MMKKRQTLIALLAVFLFYSCKNKQSEQSPAPNIGGNGLPQDVMQKCSLDSAQFNSWFRDGKAAKDGFVNPANSVAFVHDSNCNFYRWSEQMFLWLTSRDKRTGNDGSKTVMESPIFYTVTPDTTNNFAQNRALVQHTEGSLLNASPRIRQVGPNNLNVIVDKKGRIHEVEEAATNEKPTVKNAAGKLMKVAQVQPAANGLHTFVGEDNKPIESPQAVIKHKGENIVAHFKASDGKDVYIDQQGNEVEAETGQATADILVDQNGSVVYYILFVNDVYAWYHAGVAPPNKVIFNPNQFPTTAGARDSICALARANGHILTDSNALAIELKTSWVEAKNLPDAESNYVVIDAKVPQYKLLPGGKAWVMNGEKQVKLALTGVHIVGSVAGHPEMIWATFEHRKNTPSVAYQYLDSTGHVKTVPRDTTGKWLFTSNPKDTSGTFVNQTHQHWSYTGGDTVYSDTSTFLPSNVLRMQPWGSQWDSATNQEDKSSAASNSQIIALNNAVYNLLPGNDVRKNYLLIGATWTFGGTGPTGNVYANADTSITNQDSLKVALNGVAIGTDLLANSTMETFFQSSTQTCFTCHQGGGTLNPNDLSHIFQYIIPFKLPTAPASMKK